MATYAQRVTGRDTLQRAGLGLEAVINVDDDFIWVHDPKIDNVPTGGGAVPSTGQAPSVTWRQWAGTDAVTAYGL